MAYENDYAKQPGYEDYKNWVVNSGQEFNRGVSGVTPEMQAQQSQYAYTGQAQPTPVDSTTYQSWAQGGGPEQLTKQLLGYYSRDNSNRSGGHGLFGYDFATQAASGQDAQYTAKFLPQPGESTQIWLARLERDFPGISKSFQASGLANSPAVAALTYAGVDPNTGKSGAMLENERHIAEQNKTHDEINKFAAELKNPLSTNDPEVQRLMQLSSNQAGNAARMQGIQGPMSIANSEAVMQGTLGQYNAERKQQYFNALQYKNQDQLQQGQIQAQGRQQQWENQMGLQELQRQQSPLPTIMGVGGAVIGGVTGFFAGGPAGAAAGATGGFNAGKGLGGMLNSGGGYSAPPSSGGFGLNYGAPNKYSGL